MKAEWLLIIIPACMFIVWAVWYNLSNKWYNWRYKPENDRARKGQGPRGPAIPEVTGPGTTSTDLSSTTGIDAGSSIQIPTPINTEQDSKSTRGFFARFRKK